MSTGLSIAALCGRVMLGLFFFLPGIMKLQDWYRAKAEMFDLNLPNPDITMPVIVAVEVAAGLALVLGFRTRLAALSLMILLAFLSAMQFSLSEATSLLLVDGADILLHRLGIFGALLFVFGVGGGPLRLTRERSL